jgi:hypothetical protein
MIRRFHWFVEERIWWPLRAWLEGPLRCCYNCVDMKHNLWEGDQEEFWCDFRDQEIDPNSLCRAFKGWRKDDGITA